MAIYIPYILRSNSVTMAARLISSHILELRPNQSSKQFSDHIYHHVISIPSIPAFFMQTLITSPISISFTKHFNQVINQAASASFSILFTYVVQSTCCIDVFLNIACLSWQKDPSSLVLRSLTVSPC